LQAGALDIPCSLGRNGVTRFKREGDGKTPAGTFALIGGYWRRDRLRPPAAALALEPIKADMGWCDDPADANYNRPLRLPARARHEELLRADGLYDVVLLLVHNQSPRVRGHGSAIFFHLTRDKMDPPAGCVAISRAQMLRLLPRLSPDCVMIIR
jgi:L,D-peptidoglycan transpeptidase YkuD (ErfK/YbiS/YcfS/YnhG family)